VAQTKKDTPKKGTRNGFLRQAFRTMLVPILAVVTGLLLGGIMVAVSDPVVLRSLSPNPWRVIAEGTVDPATDIDLETALKFHANEVGVGDYMVFPRGTTFIVREIVATVDDIEDPDSQMDLARATSRATNLEAGNVAITLGFRDRPGFVFQAGGRAIWQAYRALFIGSIGDPAQVVQGWAAYQETGDSQALRNAMRPLSESLVTSIPYIFAGLAVALGFRAGLFNIGAEGQIFMGATFATYVGYSFTNLPAVIHLPLSILAGLVGGALWGIIPGWLKARTGAHEVINTIMMNYIAFRVVSWLLRGPMQRPGSGKPVSPFVAESAFLPRFFGLRLHAGLLLAILAAIFVWWLLFKTTIGFELRTVGSNPNAARYSGMNVSRNIIVAMGLSGALAGLAGANEVLGLNRFLAEAFSPGYGFDSIALALLGKSHPLGVVLAALLFGTLRSGATSMQSLAQVPIDIITMIQALVIVFIAAPEIIRWLFRLRTVEEAEKTIFARGWGS
jgi:simple sugar transport system permease protein